MSGGLQHFSVSPRPLGFGLGLKGLGIRVWGQGLTISLYVAKLFAVDVNVARSIIFFVNSAIRVPVQWQCNVSHRGFIPSLVNSKSC